jgi:hypothetical protein
MEPGIGKTQATPIAQLWVRADRVFEPIVARNLYDAARAIINKRSHYYSDEDLLKALGALLQKHGYLSGIIIDEAEDCPSSTAYQSRFGSLVRAYSLVGFSPDKDYRYIEINRRLRERHPTVVAKTIEQIRAKGGRVETDPATQLIWVNEEFNISLILSRCLTLASGSLRWVIRFDISLCPDITLAVRMTADNQSILDFYIFPSIDLSALKVRLSEQNASGLDIYRFDSPLPLFDMSQRLSLREIV